MDSREFSGCPILATPDKVSGNTSLRRRAVLTGEDEESPDGLDDGVGLAATARAQVDTGNEESDEQRHDAEREQTLTRLVPVCK